jgi:pimeloyl-ACP methyl ester carboxylesterase
MATFVLVHGAWHGGWCWEEVTPRLEAAGHIVHAPDLPSQGNDRTPVSDVTLARCAGRVAGLLATIDEPVVLVGHSFGGVVVTQAAEYASERIAGLIYVAAFLPQNGDSLIATKKRSGKSEVTQGIIMRPDGSAVLDPEIARRQFYGKCPTDRADRALARQRPQAMGTFAEPVRTGEGFARLPRAYIESGEDVQMLPQQQRDMQAALPCRPVITLPSDHSPFYSVPAPLAAALIQIAEEFGTAR